MRMDTWVFFFIWKIAGKQGWRCCAGFLSCENHLQICIFDVFGEMLKTPSVHAHGHLSFFLHLENSWKTGVETGFFLIVIFKVNNFYKI
jgi:hypothetical protein